MKPVTLFKPLKKTKNVMEIQNGRKVFLINIRKLYIIPIDI